jgi:hypothetical protein
VDSLVYLYAIVPAHSGAVEALRHEPVPGISGSSVRTLIEGGVAAIVGDVPAAEFDEEPLNRNLSRLEWLGPHAAAHQGVNHRVFQQSDALIPLSFGTVFRSDASVRSLLAERGPTLESQLQALAGCAEWVVTVRRDTPQAAAALESGQNALARLQAEIDVAGPGRRYLLERQLADARRRALLETDATAISDVNGVLTPLSRRQFHEPVVDTSATLAAGAQAETGEAALQAVGRLSLLVARDGEEQLLAAVAGLDERWAQRGYRVERTGPWPPYRFSGLQEHRA